MNNADVAIRLRLDNQASKSLKKAEQDALKGAQKPATATERAAARAAVAAERGAARQRNAYQRLAQAREQLGMRSESVIRREIQETTRAYQRLTARGVMSWREQSRAAEQMRQKVTQLTNEMGRLTKAQKAMGALKVGASVAAGVGAAAYALKDPAQRAIDYDYKLANMANTAFSERDKEGKKIGMKELEAAINKAVLQGGGTRAGAADALDKLIASGVVSSGEAIKMLPQIVKSATAANADAQELVGIGIRAMQSFDIAADDLPNILNMAIAGGQAGGFELKDMARWLPQQMAAASRSGLSGRADFAALVALNQAAVITAGNEDEAGNNVANILNKINSADTALDVKKNLKLDLPKYLAFQRERGVNSIDAFAGLITKSVEKDPQYKKLQAKLAESKNDDERKTTLKSMSAIAQGSAIGKIIQDQQAMMALIAMVNNQGYMQDVRRQVLANDVSAGGAIDKNFEFLSETTGFQTRMRAETSEMGKKEVLDNLTPGIKKIAEIFNELALEHGGLMGALTLATSAVTAFAGAAGVATLAMGGKSVIGPGIKRMAERFGPVANRASAGLTARGVNVAGIGRGALKLAGRGGLAGIGSVAGEYALGKTFGEDSNVTRYGSSALTGAGLGATVGSIVPVVGTIAGAAVGGALGLITQGISDWFNSDDKAVAPLQEPQEVAINVQQQIGLAPGLVLTNQHTDARGGNLRMSTGNINTGTPG
jgi:hypothetical protein